MLAVSLLAAGGCASSGGVAAGLLGGRGGLISEAEESELGAKEHPRIIAAFGGVYVSPQVQQAVEDIAGRLARASERPDITYQVTILNSPSVNAFALPGGYLYATRGLLALSGDADELAAVLAHEIGHVVARHAAKRQSQAIRAVLLGGVGGVLRQPGESSQALRDSDSVIASFSRGQELEADRIGVEMAVRAGYDPYAAVTFLNSMAREAEERVQGLGKDNEALRPNLQSTHPTTPERIARVRTLSRDLGFVPAQRARQSKGYLAAIDGLLYGDDPQEGFIRGREFLHAKARFAFSVPKGFSLQNSPDAVFAVGAQDAALRFDSIAVESGLSLEQYMRSAWGGGAAMTNLRSIEINGRPAAVAEARFAGWEYRLATIRFGPGQAFRFLFAAQKIDAALEADFSAMLGSLRALSEAEAARLLPLRIRVITVKAGDSVQKLAGRMSEQSRAEEKFRLLNGLSQTGRLRPGQSVKIIAE